MLSVSLIRYTVRTVLLHLLLTVTACTPLSRADDNLLSRFPIPQSDFQAHIISPKRRLVLYGNDPVQIQKHEILRPGNFPEYRILSQSHQAMMISPDNPLFGIGGTQRVCNGNEWKVFSACLYYNGSLGPYWFGAEGQESPDGVPVARTTFNADFAFLMDQYDEVFLIK